ncbi:MAG: SusC/RagA family TonB-linked outer membrane protein, partial [Bacteroidaceae bacterium]|nr:SusC/RagA family TonB-linked outer membrane protein [Bacteroidaceae bacterium]
MKLQMFACMWCAALACGGVSVHAMEALASVPQQDETVSKFISGSIIDKKTGETLIGVSVAVFQQGSLSGGTTTNLDGQFNLSRPTGDFELRLSLLGYKTLTIPASKCKPGMKIEMEEDTKELGEVVVNGFFAKDKQSFTGAVKQISGIEIKQVSGTNLISAIAALTPGMELVQNTAAGSNPNHVPELIIRGMSSFSNEGQAVNQPTIILDGTEISLQELYDLDMNEVESINVLKDAAATALYGSKAANGVIVITRKPIKESTLRVAYNFTGNVQFPVLGDYNVLNAADKLHYEQLAGLYDAKGALDPTTGNPLQWEYDKLYNERYQAIRRGQDSDWLSQPARTSFSHDHSLRIYGGAGNLRYELSGRFGDTKGVMKGDYRRRYGLGFKFDYFINNVIQISNRTNYSEVSSQDSPYGSFSQYTRMNPYDRMYNADGSVNLDLAWDLNNPLYEATLGSYSREGTHVLSNSTDCRWDINREFRITGHFNISSETGWGDDFQSPDSRMFKNEQDPDKKGYMAISSSKAVSYNGNIVGAYNKMFQDQSLLSLTAGWEINHSQSQKAMTKGIGFYSDKLAFIGNASSYPDSETPYGLQSESADVGFFTNGTYSFRNRYYADLTYRTTGSSQFGENKRFGHFWATGAGWNILNESFMESIRDHVDLFKLRGSVGYTGKVSFSPFQALTMYKYSGNYSYGTGIGAV